MPRVRARNGAPTDRIEERVEALGLVEAFRVRCRKRGMIDNGTAGLELPDDLDLIAHRVVLDRDEADEVLRTGPVPREHVGLL
jgi:hypothetical protein